MKFVLKFVHGIRQDVAPFALCTMFESCLGNGGEWEKEKKGKEGLYFIYLFLTIFISLHRSLQMHIIET